jgi:tripartite ATP-independent transporter DctP family solute receptor
VLASSIVFSWLARGRGPDDRQDARTLRVAHVLPTAHPVHRALEFMARRIGELSGGRLKLEIFPGEQLGTETQCLEQVQAGTLAITKVSAGAIGNFVSVYKVLSLPYLFRDSEHCWKTLDGSVGDELLTLLGTADDGKPSGLHGLCFYDAGSRNFYSREPILTPSDLKGKKIRVMNDPVAMDLILALGGAPTPIAWGELYTALQQRIVDGAENNPPSLLTSRHFEICKHFTLNHHTRIPDVVIVSAKIWNQLDPEEQAWIQQAADESSQFQRKLWEEESAKTLVALAEAGVKIHEPDIEPFRQAAKPLLKKYGAGKIGELVTRIGGSH